MRLHPRGRHAAVVAAFFAVVLGGAIPHAAQAQEDPSRFVLRGRVIDGQTGEPLHGAFIAPRGSDTGYLTHENGTFALPAYRQGTYWLSVELIGYESYEFEMEGPEPEPFVVTLRPDPIKLEGIRVLSNRFERRRRQVSVQVRAFEREDLVSAPIVDVVQFMSSRYGINTSFCGGGAGAFASSSGQDCILRRGQWIQPTIYIDEVRAFGGLEQLRDYRPQDLYTLEVYDRGTTILAYTHHFVERVLNGKRRLMPLAFLR